MSIQTTGSAGARSPAEDGGNCPSPGWATQQPRMGQVASRSRLVTTRDIELFTEISGDRNPIHYDADLAATTPFGGIVVQGGVGSAILNAVVAEDLPGPGSVFLALDLQFSAPIRPGDVITGIVEVVAVRDDKPVTELRVRVERDDGVTAIRGSAVCYTFTTTGCGPAPAPGGTMP